jgi:hypothetical protein
MTTERRRGAGGPGPDVVRAFAGDRFAVPLAGGQGTSWRAGTVVLKPVASGEEARTVRWLHDVAGDVDGSALRIALPLAAPDGRVVVDGWSATPWLAGEHATGDWRRRAGVARRFADAFAAVDARALPHRTDPWAVADRVAWGEEPGPALDHPVAARLGALPVARAVRRTVVHGDLAGNVLLHPASAPAVLDVSPYARPVGWSVAVLAVDVVGFEGVPVAELGTVDDDPAFPELVARAAVFRMTTDVLRGGAADPAHRAAADWAAERI